MKTKITFLLFLNLTLAFGSPTSIPAKIGASPDEKSALKKNLCCEAATSGSFSRSSIYQADATFTTDTNRLFTLGELRGRPVVLVMFFASCGYACPLIVTDMQTIRASLPVAIRTRALFVLVSFDTARDQPAALAEYRMQRSLDTQWILLHGSDDSVRELAALLGVKYKRAADGAFSHSNLITLLNSEGEIVHQRSGLLGGLIEAAAALTDADHVP